MNREEEEGVRAVTDDGKERGSLCLLTPINYQSVRLTPSLCVCVCLKHICRLLLLNLRGRQLGSLWSPGATHTHARTHTLSHKHAWCGCAFVAADASVWWRVLCVCWKATKKKASEHTDESTINIKSTSADCDTHTHRCTNSLVDKHGLVDMCARSSYWYWSCCSRHWWHTNERER